MRLKRENWSEIIDAVHKHTNNKSIPLWSAVANYYHVCITSIATDLSVKLWNVYQSIGGTRNETYASYCDLPAFWTHACTVIDAEITRIENAKQSKQHQELISALRQTGNTNGH